MSGMPAKSQIDVITHLPVDAHIALIGAKSALARGEMPGTPFLNLQDDPRGDDRDPVRNPLPRLDVGCVYREVRVGQAHPNDPQGAAGKRRLVLEVVEKACRLREVYFHENHYKKGEFKRLQT